MPNIDEIFTQNGLENDGVSPWIAHSSSCLEIPDWHEKVMVTLALIDKGGQYDITAHHATA